MLALVPLKFLVPVMVMMMFVMLLVMLMMMLLELLLPMRRVRDRRWAEDSWRMGCIRRVWSPC